jgi:hypothetical protein
MIMKPLYLTFALAVALSAAKAPETFTGVVTDTQCGAKHGMKGHSDADCVKMCVKGASQYALFDGQRVLKLSDQKTPAKFAAQKVKGSASTMRKPKRIKVSSIEPIAQ